MKRSKEVFVGHPKVSADFNPTLQRSSGCFESVSPLKGINNALFQVPSSSQFQFPDVLEAEFRLDPEFRQRVVGPERMLRVRNSLQAESACAPEQELNDSVSEVGSGLEDCASEPECHGSVFEVGSGPRCVSEDDFHDAVSELGAGQGDCSAYGVHRQLNVTVGERVRNLHLRKTGFVESDFSTDRVWSSAAQMGVAGHERSLILHATAEERSGIISLLEAPESEFSEAARTASAAAASGESVGIIGSRQVLESVVARSSLIHESSLARSCADVGESCAGVSVSGSAAPCAAALPAGRSLTYARAAANACGEVASASNSGRLDTVNSLRVQRSTSYNLQGVVAPNSRRKVRQKLHGREQVC